jgi:hypothetical protein
LLFTTAATKTPKHLLSCGFLGGCDILLIPGSTADICNWHHVQKVIFKVSVTAPQQLSFFMENIGFSSKFDTRAVVSDETSIVFLWSIDASVHISI